MRTFVVGDVHGHAELFAELLEKAGVVVKSAKGFERVPGVECIQLGDLGHFGALSARGDLMCYALARALGITVLWGNHDYATQSREHWFRGYIPPTVELTQVMVDVKPRFAVERHGYLLTHAGLHPRFMGPEGTPLEVVAELLNRAEGLPAIEDIGYRRGGNAPSGGILWRDETEGLADVPQVFGHSRGDVRRFGPNNQSWCIDTVEREGGTLCGLWLPEKRIIAVGPDAAQHETPWEDSE